MSYRKGNQLIGTGICNVSGEKEEVQVSAVNFPSVGIININCDNYLCTHFDCIHNNSYDNVSQNDYLITYTI